MSNRKNPQSKTNNLKKNNFFQLIWFFYDFLCKHNPYLAETVKFRISKHKHHALMKKQVIEKEKKLLLNYPVNFVFTAFRIKPLSGLSGHNKIYC